MDKGITRSFDSVLDTGHEFHDHRRPSIASNSTKSILISLKLSRSCVRHQDYFLGSKGFIQVYDYFRKHWAA